MPASILFCADPLHPRRVDAHFAAQAESARAVGATVALVDHDALLRGDADTAVRRVPADLGPAWYRGWMVPAGRYRELADALARRGGGLHVSPAAYRRAHELPGWYGTFAAVTPRSVWLPLGSPPLPPTPDEVAALVAPLGDGPGLVKDFVKARKHEWHEACYIPDLTDPVAAHRVVRRFVELQDDALTGGIVVRAFEPFTGADPDAGPAGGEARVWWVAGDPALTTPHPDTPDRCPEPDLTHVVPLVAALGCRFVTTDLALRTDGTWRVVEVGDGQVSDLPSGADPASLLHPLLARTVRG